jgi:hypothetical protein
MESKCPEDSLVIVNPLESVQWVGKCDVFTAIYEKEISISMFTLISMPTKN